MDFDDYDANYDHEDIDDDDDDLDANNDDALAIVQERIHLQKAHPFYRWLTRVILNVR